MAMEVIVPTAPRLIGKSGVNSKVLTQISDVALIEFHDARVERLVLPMDGTCHIVFEHLPVYRQVASERFVIWSYRALLILRLVESVELHEVTSAKDYVSDATFHADGKEVSPLSLLNESSVSSLSIVFGSGRNISFRCAAAVITLLEAVRELEEWQGPLISP